MRAFVVALMLSLGFAVLLSGHATAQDGRPVNPVCPQGYDAILSVPPGIDAVGTRCANSNGDDGSIGPEPSCPSGYKVDPLLSEGSIVGWQCNMTHHDGDPGSVVPPANPCDLGYVPTDVPGKCVPDGEVDPLPHGEPGWTPLGLGCPPGEEAYLVESTSEPSGFFCGPSQSSAGGNASDGSGSSQGDTPNPDTTSGNSDQSPVSVDTAGSDATNVDSSVTSDSAGNTSASVDANATDATSSDAAALQLPDTGSGTARIVAVQTAFGLLAPVVRWLWSLLP